MNIILLEILNVTLCIIGYFLVTLNFINFGLCLTLVGSTFGIVLFYKTKLYYQILACGLYFIIALVGLIKGIFYGF